MYIKLPKSVSALYKAHSVMCRDFEHTGLTFTLDGKLVGDIGEAIVAESYGIVLCAKRTPGVDGHTADGRTVQIKATGRSKAGPAFTPGKGVADHLIFIRIDFDHGRATILYNGPEAPVRKLLPLSWSGTKVVNLGLVLSLDKKTNSKKRLARVVTS